MNFLRKIFCARVSWLAPPPTKLIALIFFLPLFSSAQVTDNFSDGDFTNSPAWAGNTTSFLVTNDTLQSNGPQASSVIYLSTASTLIDSAEWNFLLRLDFNPSSTNQVRIYLVSDQQDLSGSLNGYFIQLGESGTAPDSLDIFKQTGGTTTKVFTGFNGIMSGSTTNSVRIRVVRHTGGTWDVYADKTGGNNFSTEGSFTDNTIITTNYFGVVCDYSTASRYNLYYFDDFSVSNINPDNTPPVVQTSTVLSNTTMDIKFSEPVEVSSAQTLSNYSINNGIGNAATATLDAVDISLVHLSFSNSFSTGTNYSLSVSGVSDLAANTMTPYTFQFAIPDVAEKFDIIINEIFPDPTPQIGLPNAEFVELYNRSTKAINLLNWELSKTGSGSPATLPNYLLLPDSFVIITSSSNSSLFAAYNNLLSVGSFPSLTNSGDNLLLKNNAGTLIHYVPYTDEWYVDETKKDGGWTIELIDAQNPCSGQDNWRASVHASGGTPGKKNSVASVNPDTTAPKLLRATLQDPNTLLLYFSESLNNGIASVLTNYSISNGVGNPALALPLPFDYTIVQLEFVQNFSAGIVYSVSTANLTDCNGNPVSADSVRFAISDTARAGDIIINEILFNPRTGGYDFVELYNRSNRVIDVMQLDILEKDFVSPETVLEQSAGATQSYLLFPHDYVVLTQNANNIRQEYFCQNPGNIVETALPNYDDNKSVCVLKVHNGEVLDSVAYMNDWHFALLDVEDGVSLERIDFNMISVDKNNWHSAASTVGFATPTYLNSQFSETGISDNNISISPEVFTPDNDGEKDFSFISYKFTEAGYACNIRIFDAVGREVRNLIKNELLGSSGQFQWDGTDNDSKKARIGIYMARIEVFNPQGKVKRFTKNIILGGKLD